MSSHNSGPEVPGTLIPDYFSGIGYALLGNILFRVHQCCFGLDHTNVGSLLYQLRCFIANKSPSLGSGGGWCEDKKVF